MEVVIVVFGERSIVAISTNNGTNQQLNSYEGILSRCESSRNFTQ